MQGPCSECGTEFVPGPGSQGVCCSRSCAGRRSQRLQAAESRQRRKKLSKPCQECGKLYGPSRRGPVVWQGTKFCSNACKYAHRRVKAPSKSCPRCNASVERHPGEKASDYNRRSYCSRSCAAYATHAKRRPTQDLGIPEFGSEAERLACMRGIWIGWQRCLHSVSSKTALGNSVMDVLSQALEQSGVHEHTRKAIYQAASMVPLPTRQSFPQRPPEVRS